MRQIKVACAAYHARFCKKAAGTRSLEIRNSDMPWRYDQSYQGRPPSVERNRICASWIFRNVLWRRRGAQAVCWASAAGVECSAASIFMRGRPSKLCNGRFSICIMPWIIYFEALCVDNLADKLEDTIAKNGRTRVLCLTDLDWAKIFQTHPPCSHCGFILAPTSKHTAIVSS